MVNPKIKTGIKTTYVPTNIKDQPPFLVATDDGSMGVDGVIDPERFIHFNWVRGVGPHVNHAMAAKAWLDKFINGNGELRKHFVLLSYEELAIVSHVGLEFGGSYYWGWDWLSDA